MQRPAASRRTLARTTPAPACAAPRIPGRITSSRPGSAAAAAAGAGAGAEGRVREALPAQRRQPAPERPCAAPPPTQSASVCRRRRAAGEGHRGGLGGIQGAWGWGVGRGLEGGVALAKR